jgi:integrase
LEHVGFGERAIAISAIQNRNNACGLPLAIERNGESALVFVSRGGLPLYRETEVHRTVDVNGTKVTKVVGVKIHKPILCTFGRMVRELGLRGISFYRLRHTFRSLATKARDRESADLMMGHRDSTTSKIYCHGDIEWDRIRRVARIVHRQLWPTVKHSADRISPMTTATAKIDGGGNGKVAVA